MARGSSQLLFPLGLADGSGLGGDDDRLRWICARSGEFRGAADIPQKRAAADDCDEGEKDDQDAEARFHGGFLEGLNQASQ